MGTKGEEEEEILSRGESTLQQTTRPRTRECSSPKRVRTFFFYFLYFLFCLFLTLFFFSTVWIESAKRRKRKRWNIFTGALALWLGSARLCLWLRSTVPIVQSRSAGPPPPVRLSLSLYSPAIHHHALARSYNHDGGGGVCAVIINSQPLPYARGSSWNGKKEILPVLHRAAGIKREPNRGKESVRHNRKEGGKKKKNQKGTELFSFGEEFQERPSSNSKGQVWQYPKERIPLLNRYQRRKKG